MGLKFSRLLWLPVLFSASSAMALQIKTSGDGVVFVGEAISQFGTAPQIYLVESDPGSSNRVRLEDAENVTVEMHGRDMVIRNAGSDGRFREMIIERNEKGNQQHVRISIGGSHQFSSSSSSFSQSSQPPAPPAPWQQDNQMIPGMVMPPPGAMMSLQPLPDNKAVEPKSEPNEFVNQQFEKEDWQGRELHGIQVVNSLFNGCNLSAVRFSGARLVNAHFETSKLHKADFSRARLVNIDFSDSDLSQADFSNARFVNVDFGEADLSGATWNDGRVCADGSTGQCS